MSTTINDCEHPDCFKQGQKAAHEDFMLGQPYASFDHKPYHGSTPQGRDWMLGYGSTCEKLQASLSPA